MRDVVRAVLFFRLGGEGSLDDIRSSVDGRFDTGSLPRNWRVLVRDVLKHDPEIEKTEEGTWVFRTEGAEAT